MRDAQSDDGEVDPLRAPNLPEGAREPVRGVDHGNSLVVRQVRELVDVTTRHDEEVSQVVAAAGLLRRDVERGDELVVDDEAAGKVDLARELLADEAVGNREGSLVAPPTV
jgi:hypothetical protein